MRIFARSLYCTSAAVATIAATPVPAIAQTQTFEFDIPAQSLDASLRAFARTSRQQIMFDGDLVRGKRSPAVTGSYSAQAAVKKLLDGSGLTARRTQGGSWVVTKVSEGNTGSGQPNGLSAEATGASVPNNGGAEASESSFGEGAGAIAEILVVGERTQNLDIRRTEDDPQPYVVFGHKEIQDSQATSLEEFFRMRLPMNAAKTSNSQRGVGAADSGNISGIDLRGLGPNQTLILIDGRRAPRVLNQGVQPNQADINGIPISAIERIEILPATAGGIYGGGAVGGVINIVRKRDYRGLNLDLTYTGTTRGGGETFRVDLSGGIALEDGKTQISFNASHSASKPLYRRDRSFWRRSLAQKIANDPSFFAVPPLGSTPNIRSATGEPLVLDNGQALGSPFTHIPVGYGGTATDGGAALVANAGQYNLELADSAAYFLGAGSTVTAGARRYLTSAPRTRSANLNLRRTFGPRVDGFLDLGISENLARHLEGVSFDALIPGNAVGNPFQQAIRVVSAVPSHDRAGYFRSEAINATGGLIARLGSGWSTNIELGWGRSKSGGRSQETSYDPALIQSAIANGSLDVFRDPNEFPWDLSQLPENADNRFGPYTITQRTGSVRLSGGLFDLPGGPLSLTTSIERRAEISDTSRDESISFITVRPKRSQWINSAYLELRAPLVSSSNSLPLIHELELQISGRHDRYKTRTTSPAAATFGPGSEVSLPELDPIRRMSKSTDYTIAARWAPTRDFFVRASYGTGFLPPTIFQLAPTVLNVLPAIFPDPLRGNRLIGSEVPYQLQIGGSPNLEPEQSKNLSFGVVAHPTFMPGLRVSLDYNRIVKSNEIAATDPFFILQNPDVLPGRVVRGPNLPGDPEGWPGPVTRIDASFGNLAKSKIKSLDIQADYELKTGQLGNIRLYGIASWMIERWQQLTPITDGYDSVGFYDGPLEWRGNAGATWELGPWEVSWNAQYFESYSIRSRTVSDTVNDMRVKLQGSERISSQVYHDVALQYHFRGGLGGWKSLFSDVTLRFGIQNFFDRRPPISVEIGRDLDGYSTYGDPRMRRFTFSMHKEFAG